jgi:hypothetical protein
MQSLQNKTTKLINKVANATPGLREFCIWNDFHALSGGRIVRVDGWTTKKHYEKAQKQFEKRGHKVELKKGEYGDRSWGRMIIYPKG